MKVVWTALLLPLALVACAADSPTAGDEPRTAYLNGAENLSACEQRIRDRFDDFNTCGQGSYASCIRGENTCVVRISDCARKANREVTCKVEQSLSSSKCVQEITLDADCQWNKSAVIVEDGREE